MMNIDSVDNELEKSTSFTPTLTSTVTNNNNKTLHEIISKQFNKTPTGRVFTKDLKDIYCMLLIALELVDKQPSKFKLNPLTPKTYPFSFQMHDALSKLQNLEITISLARTSTTISYSIKPELGIILLRKFMDGRLLHAPADRTRREPKVGVALQPTPKGVSVLQNFIKRLGLSIVPPILSSTFNSMELFKFDRHPISDSIIHSDYFIHLLFIKFIGPGPNIWSPYNLPDKLPSIKKQIERDDIFDFSVFDPSHFQNFNFSLGIKTEKIVPTKSNTRKEVEGVSPFHHKFFTNPESDAHIQYFVSNTGVRVYKDKFSTKKKPTRNSFVFTGKAAYQWLYDCTDIIYSSEILDVANLFLKKKLIKLYVPPPEFAFTGENILKRSRNGKFSADRNSFYTFTDLGWKVCQWNRRIDLFENELSAKEISPFISHYNKQTRNSSDESLLSRRRNGNRNSINELSLKDVLKDPGMRYLFRAHLENEYCVENLHVYLQIKQFEKKISVLCKLLILKEQNKASLENERKKLNKKIFKLANVCLSSAYHIYFTYLANGAPSELNIDFELREKITEILTDPQSANSERFFVMDLKTPISMDKAFYADDKIADKELSTVRSNVEYFVRTDTTETSSKSFLRNSSPILPSYSEVLSKSVSNPFIESTCIDYNSQLNSPLSPTSTSILSNLNILKVVNPVFGKIKQHIFRLMENDSLPKFVSSDVYLEALKTVDAVNAIS